MTAARVALDFVESRRAVSVTGGLLLAAGACAVLAAAVEQRAATGHVAALELRHADIEPTVAPASSPATKLALQEAKAVLRELRTPWVELLRELEGAREDSREVISLLAIEPDPGMNRVRIVAEAKSLEAALGYVRRLQQCESLRQPVLQSHEVNTKDRERPVRFTAAADWRVMP